MTNTTVRLPEEQATWTRADVEKYLSERGPEKVFGGDALRKWATEQGLTPTGTEPTFVRMPVAVFPELAAVADPKNDLRDMASVYVDPKAATVFGTDGRIGMRVAVNDVRVQQKCVPVATLDKIIPVTDGRVPIKFDAHSLLRLCLSALASVGGQATRSGKAAEVTLWPAAKDPSENPLRVEVRTGDGEVRMVGVVMPMSIQSSYTTVDPLRLREAPDAVGPTTPETDPSTT